MKLFSHIVEIIVSGEFKRVSEHLALYFAFRFHFAPKSNHSEEQKNEWHTMILLYDGLQEPKSVHMHGSVPERGIATPLRICVPEHRRACRRCWPLKTQNANTQKFSITVPGSAPQYARRVRYQNKHGFFESTQRPG